MRFVADENLNDAITPGALRLLPQLDLVRRNDIGLSGTLDPQVLEWAAREHRILLSHYARTLPKFALNRIAEGLPMAGLVR